MSGYFLRRVLLIVPTFIGITVVVFVIMQFVPGGPVERQILRFQMAMAGGGEGAGTALRGGVEIPQEELDEIKRYYGSSGVMLDAFAFTPKLSFTARSNASGQK